jgi:hypothetical protein
VRSLAVALVVLACAGSDATDSASQPVVDPCTDLTWSDFGQPYVTTWCTPCHSASVAGVDRQGAPEGVDLDTLATVRGWKSVIAQVAVGESATMPPVGGPTDADRTDLEEWLACDAPGVEAPEVETCTGDTVMGDLVIDGSSLPADVCAVTGSLIVRGMAPEVVALPLLQTIGGELRVEHTTHLSTLALPALRSDVKAVIFVDNPSLTAVDLGDLAAVTGDLSLSDDGIGGTLSLDRAHTIGGDLVVSGLPRLSELALWRLAGVGGALRIDGVPALDQLVGTDSLRSIGGTLTIDGAGLGAVEGFTNLTAVDGIQLSRMPVVRLDAFTWLPQTGSVVLSELPELVSTHGFHNLTAVDGPLSLTGAPIGLLDGFRQLERVGMLEIRDAQTPTLAVLAALRDVDGDLVLDGNPGLAVVTGLHGVEHVGGDLVVRSNPRLTPADIARLVGAIDTIDGTIVLD